MAVALGDAKNDLASQGVRAAGAFDTNYILFPGSPVRYRFKCGFRDDNLCDAGLKA